MLSADSQSDATAPCQQAWRARRGNAILVAMLLAITAVNFCRTVNYDFLDHWDDGVFILENPRLDWTFENLRHYATQPFQDLYTPLPMYSLMADNALFGHQSPLPYHLHNLALHLACAALLYWIARKLRLSPTWAFLAALLWSVNPQKSESVVWITERKDVQCGLFAFAAFLMFLFELDCITTWKQVYYAIICGILAALAIFAKPAAAPLTGIFVVYALAFNPRKNARTREWLLLLIPVGCALAATAWSAYVTTKTNPGAFSWSPAVPLHNLLWYPVTAVLPNFGVNPIYPNITGFKEYWALYLIGVLLLGVLLWYALAIRHIAWQSLLGGALILGGTMLPVLGMWVYTNFDYCDRYNYLVSAVAVVGLALIIPENRHTRLGAVLLIALMMLATQLNLDVWHDTQTFWRTLIARDGRVNPKVFEVAANDALIRDDAEDLDNIVGFLRQHRNSLESPRLSLQQVDNTIVLLESHASLLREERSRFLAQIAPLMLQEAATGAEPPFMRGQNYPLIYRRNADFALRLNQFLPLQIPTNP
ncbi:MAG: glycosyltransferase family 39 protein [Victivallales bacterium]|nr:glycosyltransferase family 39 protein [Victivallales bacterium]